METLYVRTDGYATTGLANDLNPERLIPMIPSSKIALPIADTDIPSHYTTHLRKVATQPAMLKCYPKHYGWSTAQCEMIDWKAHQSTLQKLQFVEQTIVTKFIHQSLPMGTLFHWIDPSQLITCSSCKVTPESATHLHRCSTQQVCSYGRHFPLSDPPKLPPRQPHVPTTSKHST
jgi:hypothetical protein